MSVRKRIRLCLYIADSTENSERARANLAALCDNHLIDQRDIEVVDVMREPERALDAGIIMTPTLIKVWPLPEQRIVGTLNNIEPLLRILGVKGAAA